MMTEKFAVEGKCPECGKRLEHIHNKFYSCHVCLCAWELIDVFGGYRRHVHEEVDMSGYQFYPAAPSEPSATLNWARMLMAYLESIQAKVDIRRYYVYPTPPLEQLLAAAPVEVRETPQSGEEVKDE